MSLSQHLRRKPPLIQPLTSFLRRFSTPSQHHNDHLQNHEYLSPHQYINSWKPPKTPKEAEAKLAMLRREYAKNVKQVRKSYIQEMETQRLEKLRKDEAKKEAQRIANEERKAAKAAEKKAKAKERELAQQQFRETLLKERAEKLEYWRMREKRFEEKKKEKKELVRRKSSMFIDEDKLERRVLEVIVDRTPL